MPVQFGIVCDRCRTLHLISRAYKSPRLQYDRLRGEFKLSCVSPCNAILYFHRGMLVPYVVPTKALSDGYVSVDDCTAVPRMA
jgi:hypothetical protein